MSIHRGDVNISVDMWVELLNDSYVFMENDINLLLALYNCNECKERAAVLATILGVKGHYILNMQTGKLGKRIINKVHDIVIPVANDGEVMYWNILFWGESAEIKGRYYWILRPELKEALERSIISKKYATDERNIDESEDLYEGAKKQIVVNAYERNSTARLKCIKYHGHTCKICGFDFLSFYGGKFNGIIHIHHIKPISDIMNDYKINPKDDLIPVCPNCHAAIHSKTPPYTPDELRDILSKTR